MLRPNLTSCCEHEFGIAVSALIEQLVKSRERSTIWHEVLLFGCEDGNSAGTSIQSCTRRG